VLASLRRGTRRAAFGVTGQFEAGHGTVDDDTTGLPRGSSLG